MMMTWCRMTWYASYDLVRVARLVYAPPLPLDLLASRGGVGTRDEQRIAATPEAHPMADRQRLVQLVEVMLEGEDWEGEGWEGEGWEGEYGRECAWNMCECVNVYVCAHARVCA